MTPLDYVQNSYASSPWASLMAGNWTQRPTPAQKAEIGAQAYDAKRSAGMDAYARKADTGRELYNLKAQGWQQNPYQPINSQSITKDPTGRPWASGANPAIWGQPLQSFESLASGGENHAQAWSAGRAQPQKFQNKLPPIRSGGYKGFGKDGGEAGGGGGNLHKHYGWGTAAPQGSSSPDAYQDSPDAYQTSPDAYQTSPDAYQTNPDAYTTNPDAYGQVSSSYDDGGGE